MTKSCEYSVVFVVRWRVSLLWASAWLATMNNLNWYSVYQLYVNSTWFNSLRRCDVCICQSTMIPFFQMIAWWLGVFWVPGNHLSQYCFLVNWSLIQAEWRLCASINISSIVQVMAFPFRYQFINRKCCLLATWFRSEWKYQWYSEGNKTTFS